jgi:site-specific DNA recombinase
MIQAATEKTTVRCAIYTRKSHEEGLEQEFNSLHAQREAGEAYIASQRHAGWVALPTDYSDGGFTGGNMDRPGLEKLLADIQRNRVDCVVVYKVDRLSRSLMDFAQMIALFDQHDVAFVSVTQHFDTSTSMGRLILNVLLSFAQFEREIIGERIRDKKLATAKQGKYVGGQPFLGYDIDRERKRLIVNPAEAQIVREIFEAFIRTRSTLVVARELNATGYRTKQYKAIKNGKVVGGKRWNKVYVYRVVTNRKYLGEVVHKGQSYPGEHEAVLDRRQWDEAQRIMADNYHARADKTRQKVQALLTGIVRCGHCGKAMGASHTKRRGRRYRYYVCNHAEKNGYDTCPVKSVAAGQIEGAVKDRIRVILRSPDLIARTFREVQAQAESQRADLAGQKERLEARLADLKRAIGRLARSDGNDGLVAELTKLNEEYGQTQNQVEEVGHAMEALGAGGSTEDDVREALQKLDPLWDELFPAEKERIVKLLVQEVVVGRDSLLIRLRLHGLNSLVAELAGDDPAEGAGGRVVPGADGQTVDVRVPMEFKTRSGRKEIILPPDAATTADVGPRSPLVVALARAYRWQRMIDSGEVPGMEAIAERSGVNRTYVARMLQLTSLAPEFVQAVLAGTEPSGVSLTKLRHGVPPMWDEQRRLWLRG